MISIRVSRCQSARVVKRLLAFSCHLLVFILFFLINASVVTAFNIPEKFEYDLTWAGIKAGTATLEITSSDNHIKIVSTARSAKVISVFYTVDDRVESTLVKSQSSFMGQPANYRLKIREGRHRRDKEIIFQHDTRMATYIDHLGNERYETDVPSSVFDPISGFYYMRTLKLEVGKPVYVTIFDSKKIWDVEVQVLKKEKVTIPAGTFDTILVKPLMKSEGIFYKKGDIHIWLTDDEKRIPVKMQTKVAVGSITATLVGGLY